MKKNKSGPGLNLYHFMLTYISWSSGKHIKIHLESTEFVPLTDMKNMDISLTYRKHGGKAKMSFRELLFYGIPANKK